MGTDNDRSTFEKAIEILKSDITTAATIAISDANIRPLYDRTINDLAKGLREDAEAGRMSWGQAAKAAQEMRNNTMELLRGRTSPISLALAQKLKKEGMTFNELIAKNTIKMRGPQATFDALSDAEKNQVYLRIINSAGRANPQVNAFMKTASRFGRGLILLSLAISVYQVATADDPWSVGEREAAVTLGGIGAAAAGGALAGLACGPGAPVCVGLGAFVAGTIAAFGIQYAW